MRSTQAADVQAKSTNWFVAITSGKRPAVVAFLGFERGMHFACEQSVPDQVPVGTVCGDITLLGAGGAKPCVKSTSCLVDTTPSCPLAVAPGSGTQKGRHPVAPIDSMPC